MAEFPFDPVAAWQKFVSDWEKQINSASASVVGTEEFSRIMNQATQFTLATQQQFDKHMEQFLKTVHLASKTDIAAIHDRLAAIEESIERLSNAIAPRDRPVKREVARTRQPPPESQ